MKLLAVPLLLACVGAQALTPEQEQTIATTPCMKEVRAWTLEPTQNGPFTTPPGLTLQQCQEAKYAYYDIDKDDRKAREDAARTAMNAKREADQAALRAEAKARTERYAAWVKSRKPLRLGMTPKQVVNETAWGEPEDVNRTTTASGVREQWVYGLKRYLYFTNGRLTAVQD